MALLEISESAMQSVSLIVSTIADNWIPLTLFLLFLGITVVIVCLSLTQIPKILSSWTIFIETATENIPRLTSTINKLVNNVSTMNDKLTSILNLESKIDYIKDQVHDNETAIYKLKDKIYENDTALRGKLDLIFSKL